MAKWTLIFLLPILLMAADDFIPDQSSAPQTQAVAQAPVDEPIPDQPTEQVAAPTSDPFQQWIPSDLKSIQGDPWSPDWMKAVATKESGLNPNGPDSAAGARGLFQFTKATAQDYGLTDRRDPVASYNAAHAYLTKLYNEFGDRDLALAGYNWGPDHIRKMLLQGKDKQEILASAVPETQDYVSKVNSIHNSLTQSQQQVKQATQSQQDEPIPDGDQRTIPSGWHNIGDLGQAMVNLGGAAAEFARSTPSMIAGLGGTFVANWMNNADIARVILGGNNNYQTPKEVQQRVGQFQQRVQGIVESAFPDSLKGWLSTNQGAKQVDKFFNDYVNKGITNASNSIGQEVDKKFGTNVGDNISASIQEGITAIMGGLMAHGVGKLGGNILDRFKGTDAPPSTGGPSPNSTQGMADSIKAFNQARGSTEEATPETSPVSGAANQENVENPNTDYQAPQAANENQATPAQGELPIFEGITQPLDLGDKARNTAMPNAGNVSDADIAQEQINQQLTQQPQNPGQGLLFPEQGRLDFEGNGISSEEAANYPKANDIDRAYALKEAQQKAEAASLQGANREPLSAKDDIIQPAQGSPNQVKVVLPSKMRGSSTLPGDMADLALKGMDVLKSGLRRLSFGPFGAGDTVRLMDGRIGSIQGAPTPDGVFNVRVDGGEQVKVPASGINYKYKYSGDIDNPVGYRKPIYIPGKQGGALNLGAFTDLFKRAASPKIDPSEPSKTGEILSRSEALQRLYTLYNHASDSEDFQRLIRAEIANNPAFNPSHLAEAKDIFDAFSDPAFSPPKSPHGQLGIGERRLSVDTRPFEQAAREDSWDGMNKQGDILPVVESIAPTHMLVSSQWGKMGSRILSNAYGQMTDLKALTSQVKRELIEKTDAFNSLPRNSKMNVMKAIARFDHGDLNDKYAEQAGAQGRFWPTPEELKDAGLSPEEEHAYNQLASMYQEGYKVGGITQPQMYGYMPHFRDGSWKVKIWSGDNGTPAYLKLFSTRWQAERFLKNVTTGSDELNLSARIEEPQNGLTTSTVEQLVKDLQNWQGKGKLSGVNRDILQKKIVSALQGTLVEDMERHGTRGFIGENGPLVEGGNLYQKILNKWENNKSLGIHNRFIDDVTRAYRNTRIMDNIAKPFYRRFTDTQEYPQLVKAFTDMVGKATGFAQREKTELDTALRTMIIKAGGNPAWEMGFINGLNRIVREIKISSINPTFVGKHFLFTLYGISDLLLEHSNRGSQGLSQGSLMQAIEGASAMTNVWRGAFKDPVDQAAYEWFKRTNTQDNLYGRSEADTVASKINHGALNWVVNQGRRGVFMANFKYFRDIMPFESAKRAAETATKRVMQSFDSLDRPGIFNEGALGTSLKPFNQIKFHQIFRQGEALSAIKNNKGVVNKLLPAMSLIVTQLMLGGVMGMIGMGEYDLARRGLNALFPKINLPGPLELASRAGDWATLGPISKYLKTNISGTFSFPSIGEAASGAGISWGVNFLVLAGELMDRAMSGESDVSDIYSTAKRVLPEMGNVLLENMLSKQQGTQNFWLDNKLMPIVPKKPGENTLHNFTGGIPYRKALAQTKRDILEDQNSRDQGYAERAATVFMQNIRGLNTGRDNPGEIYRKAVSAGRGVNPDLFFSNIVQKSIDSKQPWITSYLLKQLQDSNKFQEARRLQNIIQQFGSVSNAVNQ